jgi:polyhydroxybutyrate depolymerase
MRPSLRFIVICLATSFVLTAGVWRYFAHADAPLPPSLSAPVRSEVVHVGALDRSFLAYVPQRLPPRSPLVIVLHSGRQSAEDARIVTGYEFDVLADKEHFAVAYPNGYDHYWNDCRRVPAYAARALDVDDKAFLRALQRVFVVGYGNGAQMAYRLALESAANYAGIAAIAGNLPTQDNMRCAESGVPVPVLIMDGTGDPLSPYGGGIQALLRFANRGTVISAPETADYFARLDGQQVPPVLTALPHRQPEDPTSVERSDWNMGGRPEVVLDTVRGGGHVVPQAAYRPARILGPVTHDLDGPAEIWSFFARQRSRAVPENSASTGNR